MFNKNCNIDQTDRTNRIVIGTIICLAAILEISWVFYFVAGLVLIVEGVVGRCYIPKILTAINKTVKNLKSRNTINR